MCGKAVQRLFWSTVDRASVPGGVSRRGRGVGAESDRWRIVSFVVEQDGGVVPIAESTSKCCSVTGLRWA